MTNTPSTEDKYKFLLDMLTITDLNLCENDGLLRLKTPIYFQFGDTHPTVDEAVEAALVAHRDELWPNTKNTPK